MLHVVWDKPIQVATVRVCQCMSVLQRLGKPIFPTLKSGCLFPTFLFWRMYWKRQHPAAMVEKALSFCFGASSGSLLGLRRGSQGWAAIAIPVGLELLASPFLNTDP